MSAEKPGQGLGDLESRLNAATASLDAAISEGDFEMIRKRQLSESWAGPPRPRSVSPVNNRELPARRSPLLLKLASLTHGASGASSSIKRKPIENFQLTMLEEENDRLREEIRERKESYLRREKAMMDENAKLKVKLSAMETKLADLQLVKDRPEALSAVKGLHSDILSKIDTIKTNAVNAVAEKEGQMLRKLHMRLRNLELQLLEEKEGQLQLSGPAEDFTKETHSITKELEKTHNLAMRLDHLYRASSEEVKELRRVVKLMEEEKELLLANSVKYKRSCKILRERAVCAESRPQSEATSLFSSNNTKRPMSAVSKRTVTPSSTGRRTARTSSRNSIDDILAVSRSRPLPSNRFKRPQSASVVT